jgi:hypothetical protein
MGHRKRRNARDVLDRPNVWFPPPLPVILVREPPTSLSLPSPFTRVISPVWVRAWSSQGSWTRFLGSPSFRTCSLPCFHLIRQHSTVTHLATLSHLANGRPSQSGPGLTSSHSHRLYGRRCQHRNPKIRPLLGFLQNGHKLVSLSQETTDHLQISVCAIPERFAHRAPWSLHPPFPIGSRTAPGSTALFTRVTCPRWRSGRQPSRAS